MAESQVFSLSCFLFLLCNIQSENSKASDAGIVEERETGWEVSCRLSGCGLLALWFTGVFVYIQYWCCGLHSFRLALAKHRADVTAPEQPPPRRRFLVPTKTFAAASESVCSHRNPLSVWEHRILSCVQNKGCCPKCSNSVVLGTFQGSDWENPQEGSVQHSILRHQGHP